MDYNENEEWTEFKKLRDKYKKTWVEFGFGDYAIDFSHVSIEGIKFLSECMKKYNENAKKAFLMLYKE